MLKKTAALVFALCIIWSIPAPAQSYPLPPWYFYGGGDAGTWDGSSTAPDNVSLSVTINSQPPPLPPGAQETAVASSSAGVLLLEPRTMYALTFAARINGYAVGHAVFVDDSTSIAGISVQGSGWNKFTNSFTTGGLTDPHVGQNLYVQLFLTGLGSRPGTTSASFTNIQLQVTSLRPALAIRPGGAGQFQLQWPTNSVGYAPESTSQLLTGAWESVTNSPAVQSNQYVIPLSFDAGQRFFRLRQD